MTDSDRNTYRENLRLIAEKFPDCLMLKVKDVSKFLGVDYRTLLADRSFPVKSIDTGKKNKTHLVSTVGLAQWMSR